MMPDTRSGRTASVTQPGASTQQSDSDEANFETPTNSPPGSRAPSPQKHVLVDQDYLETIDTRIEAAISRTLADQISKMREDVLKAVDTRLKMMRDDIVQDFDYKMLRMSNRLEKLEKENAELKDKVEINQEDIVTHANNHEKLEQYGRRLGVRVTNVPWNGLQEKDEDLLTTVQEALQKVDITLHSKDVVRLHRLGDETFDRAGTKCKNIIIKMNNWSALQTLLTTNKNAARKKKAIRVFHDLTTPRFRIFNHAKKRIAERFAECELSEDDVKHLADNEKMFVFLTPNCDLRIRSNGRVHKFQSIEEANKIIQDYVPPRF